MARRPKTTTMAQVAEHAGVSQATVSLVLNNVAGSRVAEATKERVLDAVRDLDYRTNAFAKTLRSGESEMIGFISDEVASSPFAGGLLKGAQLLAWENGNVILTVDTYNDAGLEQAAVEMMQSYRVRGVVYASMYHRVIDVPQALSGVPTVVVNAQDRAGLVPSVFPDEEMGGYAATRQLVDAGHTKIAMINIQPEVSDLPAGIGRRAGFRRALTEAGLSARPDWLLSGTGIVEDGLRLTAQLMDGEDRPTAIFCGNDRTAWGAYRALEARGLSVPDDCSIIGFDNHEMLAPHLDPGLSTVALPYEQMAGTAIDLLLNPTPSPSLHIPLECTVVTRGSVAKAKA
ncbi:LacI family DNA-binding transcriptional regulator [Pseudoclavibacter helvolus]|uniref:LacI family transcriptional regulator n=1 Tax=Pseudoclavibacter helvolus TaxID=255205 RepID=A0A7W4UN90_9MICO|nr:LacI family DNA-binding transcriptional regulator [Pseudoclavibacter helvolus]MBB2957164.1 LacI family transcriptional regulator [Pseudoclavibacter helvolus]